jgi:dephospho-CoA kinase
MTPADLLNLSNYERQLFTIIYLDISEDIRKSRLLLRNMPGDTLDRRIESDELDFKDFKNYDLRITNPDF